MSSLGAESGRVIEFRNPAAALERAERYIDHDGEGGCWIWTGFGTTKTDEAYGRFQLHKRRAVLAHRAVYTLLVGPIPEGMTLDHTCHVRRCVNPAHLEVVSNAENIRRAKKTHCRRGHLYEGNVYVSPDGSRTCITCRRAAWRARNAA